MPQPQRPIILHPAVALICSTLGALIYSAWITFRFSGEKLTGLYIYVVPIVIPFIAFLLDRVGRVRQSSALALTLDAAVVLTAMWRVIGDVPFVSGHALFLSYALLSTGENKIVQITAGLVLLQVIYLKYVVWHDWVTPTTGILLGLLASLVRHRFALKTAANLTTA